MQKLMTTYADRKGVDMKSIRFTFDGERVDSTKTAADMGLEDGDTIETMVQQTGGCMGL